MEHMSSDSAIDSPKRTHGVRARRADWRISRSQMALGSRPRGATAGTAVGTVAGFTGPLPS